LELLPQYSVQVLPLKKDTLYALKNRISVRA
jgi:hypothetical protein